MTIRSPRSTPTKRTFAMIIVSVALSLIMPESIIARATAMFMGLCACAFLPAFVHGLFSKSPSTLGAKLSLGLGGGAWFFWTFFVHIKESSILGISRFLTGHDAITEDALAGRGPHGHSHSQHRSSR